ncbi:MAG: L-2-hydroxyglutarate oxidase [Planctomycetota bacterium]|nr:MAG: L-2-hydroxyglutarate oxidase [Planctomycetota bacterium]
MSTQDVTIIGAGIVGLATAYQTLRARPGLDLLVLDKETALAAHQTAHNSGVIHSGIYYKPGSLKARNCRRGREMLIRFCRDHAIPFDLCGKVIVAVNQRERPALQRIYERGIQNGVACDMIDPTQLRDLEPHAAGIGAIHVHDAGIVSFLDVCRALVAEIERLGGRVLLGAALLDAARDRNDMLLTTSAGRMRSRVVVNCAGLQSDRVARLLGTDVSLKIVPFRGEYYELCPAARSLCRNLIYPVPDPAFPFLGVHFTRMINGSVECGPNAVLALGREAYARDQLNIPDLADTLAFPAFWKLASRHWRTGAGEVWRSLSKTAFVRALQRLVPEITADQLTPAPAGIRAQALAQDGSLLDDFAIVEDDRVVNVCNAPSPAATSSLSIGLSISEHILHRLTPRAQIAVM